MEYNTYTNNTDQLKLHVEILHNVSPMFNKYGFLTRDTVLIIFFLSKGYHVQYA
jgi:hypothetical protein